MPDGTTGTRSATACVDASFVVRVLDAPRYPSVQREWERLVSTERELIAPTLFSYEVANALHQQQRVGKISAERAADGLQRVLRLPIELHGDAGLHSRALEIACEHQLPTTYNAHYVALAERLRVPLWTCDQRLAEAIAEGPPEVRLVLTVL
ncbi:MAG TPA: type II toxin-antitoxin system VapC family toxin [Pseudonocardiaceae bacterium]|nr:type II toxin-antitoxin system VapC family toxin [Pseudonocardiaceae bacterium]